MNADNIRYIDGQPFRDSPIERRVMQTPTHPARRRTDVSPAIARFLAARDRGEGLGRRLP